MKRKAKLILLFFLMVTVHFAQAQEKFNYNTDFKKVLARSKDQKDSLCFDKLMIRFLANDSTLSDFQVLALLIGFTDKPEYKPYDDLRMEREIYKLNGAEKFQQGLDSANIFLRTHPLNVKVLYEKWYSFFKLGQKDSAQYYLYQGREIFQAMYYSGDGKTKDAPTFALGPADGQEYIRKYMGEEIGVMGSGMDKHGNFIDILEVKYEDGHTMNMYFIIQHATDKMFGGESIKEEIKEQKNSSKKKKGK